jgi:hypothetical protein
LAHSARSDKTTSWKVRSRSTARLARALYRDDPTPIDTGSEQAEAEGGEQGWGLRYRDMRMRRLDAYLTNAELTQCAHRNRPLRHDGRVVVTLCHGEIGFLPVTETIHALPLLDGAGIPRNTDDDRGARLEAAYQALIAEKVEPSVRLLSKRAKVGHTYTAQWLRERRSWVEGSERGEGESGGGLVGVVEEVG